MNEPELPRLPKPDYAETDGVASTDYWRVESLMAYGRDCRQAAEAEIERWQRNAEFAMEAAAKAELELAEVRQQREQLWEEAKALRAQLQAQKDAETCSYCGKQNCPHMGKVGHR